MNKEKIILRLQYKELNNVGKYIHLETNTFYVKTKFNKNIKVNYK